MIYNILMLIGLLFLTIVIGGLCNQIKFLREEFHMLLSAVSKSDVRKAQENIDTDREELTEKR